MRHELRAGDPGEGGARVNVRLVQLDGALPNLALMKLAHWHRAQGDVVHLTRHVAPTLFESQYDRVYGSSIFVNLPGSYERRELFKQQWPEAVLGGTGTAHSGVRQRARRAWLPFRKHSAKVVQ